MPVRATCTLCTTPSSTLGFSIKLSKDPHGPANRWPHHPLPGVGAFGGFMEGLETTLTSSRPFRRLPPAVHPCLASVSACRPCLQYSTEMGQHPGLESPARQSAFALKTRPALRFPTPAGTNFGLATIQARFSRDCRMAAMPISTMPGTVCPKTLP